MYIILELKRGSVGMLNSKHVILGLFIVVYITILLIVPLLKLKFAIPYIAAKVDQPVVDEPGPAVVIEPGHHSLEEHPVMAFVVVKLVTKEEA